MLQQHNYKRFYTCPRFCGDNYIRPITVKKMYDLK